MKKGFTLIETLIVATMIGILVVILIPQYKYSVIRAREAVLKEDLFQMRDAISKFFYDKKKYPDSLEDLVSYRYLRKVPEDPFMRTATWEPVHAEPIAGEEYDPETAQGIIDVKTLNPGTALDGTKYADW